MYNKVTMNFTETTRALEKDNVIQIFPNKAKSDNESAEYELIKELPNDNTIQLPSDHLDSIKRKVLIGIKAFGIHQPAMIAGYAGISSKQYEEIINESEIQEILKNPDLMPCLTKGEILAMLSIEAQNSPKGGDRIAALKLLMEFRGLAAPEGGAKSFARIVQRFKR